MSLEKTQQAYETLTIYIGSRLRTPAVVFRAATAVLFPDCNNTLAEVPVPVNKLSGLSCCALVVNASLMGVEPRLLPPD